MRLTARYPSADAARAAVHQLVGSSFPVEDIHVIASEPPRELPVVRRHPVVRYAMTGFVVGAFLGGAWIVVSGIVAPEATHLLFVGLAVLGGTMLGAVAGMSRNAVEVQIPDPSVLDTRDGFRVELEVPEGRAERARTLLQESGGTLRTEP